MRKLLWLVALVGCKSKSDQSATQNDPVVSAEEMRKAPSKYEGATKAAPTPMDVAHVAKSDEDRKEAVNHAQTAGVLADGFADKNVNLPAAKPPAASKDNPD